MVKRIVPNDVDFNSYKDSLIEFLKGQDRFSDMDFEGSNLSVLINLLTYNTYNMLHYGAMVGNEAWPDTALLRQSLVSHATSLNYLPRSRTSARATLEVQIYPSDNPQSIILPKNYRFKSTDAQGNTVYFVTNQDYIATPTQTNEYIFKDVVVYQGEIITEFFDITGVTSSNGYTIYPTPYAISSENIDIASLEVWVGANASDPNPIKYTRADNLEETTDTSLTYFIRPIYTNQYAIEFGDGTFGAPLTNGNRVTVKFRNTNGALTNGNYIMTKTTDISGYSDIVINSATRVQGGFERETNEQLRVNAPRHFQTQNRAVTDDDYETLIKSNFPNIQQVSVYGGEEIAQYGKVIVVVKPFGITGTISDVIKTQIIEFLKTKNIVPEPIIMDPTFFYLGINSNVYYSGDIINTTENQLRSNIENNLTDLNNTEIGDFNVTVYQSLINQTIKGSDNSITGVDSDISMIYRWQPGLNINETLQFTTYNPLKISADGEYRNSNNWTITSTAFTIFYNGLETNVVIQDDGIGNLFHYTIDEMGNKTKISNPIGTVNYETGAVSLVTNILDYINYIEFNCTLATDSIEVKLDSFVIISPTHIDLTMHRI